MEFVIGGLFVVIAALVGVTPKLRTMRLEKRADELATEIQSECWHIQKPHEGDSGITSSLRLANNGTSYWCPRCHSHFDEPDAEHVQRLENWLRRDPEHLLRCYVEEQGSVLTNKIGRLVGLRRRLLKQSLKRV